jgi:hypothetical protein
MKKALLCMVVSILLCVTRVGTASATSIVGVEVGQWAMYKYTVCTNSTISPDVNSTHQYIEVLAVSGTNITFKDMIIAPNGSTISNRLVWTDVETGNGTDSGWFVGANLTAGDVIFPANPFTPQLTLNDTIFRSYLNETVEVNRWTLTNSTSSYFDFNMTQDADYCWIRASGMAAEMYVNMTTQYQNGTSFSMAMDIVISGTGIVPEFPLFLILPLFMIATSIAVATHKRKPR